MESKSTNRQDRQRARLSTPPPRRSTLPNLSTRRGSPHSAPSSISTTTTKTKDRSFVGAIRRLTSQLELRLKFLKKLPLKVVVPVLFLSILLVGFLVQKHALTQSAIKTQYPDVLIENLEYQTILPNEKTISKLGGWTRVSPPDKPPVYAYSDRIGNVPISVSQQPLPDSFMGRSDQKVAELAKAYSANSQLDIEGSPAYIGTSAKGPQSVIFTRNNLLVMIKSQKKIPNPEWVKYIQTLN